MKEDIFFLSFFIKEKIYVIDKEEIDFSLGTGEIPISNEEIKNTTHLVYLVLHQEPAPLSAAQEELLQNILKAINVAPNQVEKLAMDNFQPNQVEGRKFVFILSAPPLPKPFNQLEKNKTRTLTEGTQVLVSDSLSVLTASKQDKLALWAELKKTFGLK